MGPIDEEIEVLTEAWVIIKFRLSHRGGHKSPSNFVRFKNLKYQLPILKPDTKPFRSENSKGWLLMFFHLIP